jgi:hypothetical protein
MIETGEGLSSATALSMTEDIAPENLQPIERFLLALKAPETQRQYPRRLESFFDFLRLQGSFEEKTMLFYSMINVQKESEWLTNQLLKFLRHQKERVAKGEIEEATIANYFKSIKLFCEMNNIISINWKLISRSMPKGRHASNDRPPSREEIIKLLKHTDRRIRPVVLVMISSGIRVGAWDYLKWKHIVPIIRNKEIIAGKLKVYAGENEEYSTFVTPEAYRSIAEWMDFRASYGEKITGESWLMRDMWRTVSMKYGAKVGLAKDPKQLKSSGIKVMVDRALQIQGIRGPLRPGTKRHEFKTLHGFRKFFKTQTEQVMKSINVEICMGHNIGVSKSYYKPSENELLEDYIKAVDLLTINNYKSKLEKEVKQLSEKSESEIYTFQAQLMEREREIHALRNKDLLNTDAIASLSDRLSKVMKDIEMLKTKL